MMWRTDAGGLSLGDFPSTAYLSVSAHGEMVLGLGDQDAFGKTEIVVLNSSGTPTLSADALGKLVDAPRAVPAGIDLPLAPGLGDKFGMRVDLLKREDLTQGLCGARWLTRHAATSSLATAAAACKP